MIVMKRHRETPSASVSSRPNVDDNTEATTGMNPTSTGTGGIETPSSVSSTTSSLINGQTSSQEQSISIPVPPSSLRLEEKVQERRQRRRRQQQQTAQPKSNSKSKSKVSSQKNFQRGKLNDAFATHIPTPPSSIDSRNSKLRRHSQTNFNHDTEELDISIQALEKELLENHGDKNGNGNGNASVSNLPLITTHLAAQHTRSKNDDIAIATTPRSKRNCSQNRNTSRRSHNTESMTNWVVHTHPSRIPSSASARKKKRYQHQRQLEFQEKKERVRQNGADESNSGMEDQSSVGDSTITSQSSTESVFDRLYRMGQESAQHKKDRRRRQKAKEQNDMVRSMSNFGSSSRRYQNHPRSSTPVSKSLSSSISSKSTVMDSRLKARRLSYASKSAAPSPRMLSASPSSNLYPKFHRNQQQQQQHFSSRKNRVSAYIDSKTSTTYSNPSLSGSTQKATSKPFRGTTRTHSNRKQNNVLDSDDVSTTSSTTSSVFDRLFRNEKRSESLWSPPPAITPPRKKRSPIDLTSGTKERPKEQELHSTLSSGSRIPFNLASEERSESSALSVTKQSSSKLPPRKSNAPSSPHVDVDLDEADDRSVSSVLNGLLDDLVASVASSPRTMTTVAVTEDDGTSVPSMTDTKSLSLMPRRTQYEQVDTEGDILDEILRETKDDDFSKDATITKSEQFQRTTTLEEDFKEIEEIRKTISKDGERRSTCKNPDHKRLADTNIVESVAGTMDIIPPSSTTIEEDLQEIAEIARVLSVDVNDEREEHIQSFEKDHAPLLQSAIFPDISIDEDIEELVNIGRELSGEAGSPRRRNSRHQESSPVILPRRTTSLDEDIAEIESIGKELHPRISPSLSNNSKEMTHISHDKTPSVVFIPGCTNYENKTVDMLQGIEDSTNEEMKMIATASAPKQRGQRPFKAEENLQQNGNPRMPSLHLGTSYISSSVPPASTGNESHASSGFFSLDEKSGGLVLDYRNKNGEIDYDILQPIETQDLFRTSHYGKGKAATLIQAHWRRVHIELLLAKQFLTEVEAKVSHGDGTQHSLSKHKGFRGIERMLILDPYVDRGVQMDSHDIVVSWETCFFGSTLTIIAHATSIGWYEILQNSWPRKKLAQRLLRIAIEQVPSDASPKSISDIQRLSKFAGLPGVLNKKPAIKRNFGLDPMSLLSKEQSNKPIFMDMDTDTLKRHRAAAILQNWFRMCKLKEALDNSSASQEQLREILDIVSGSDANSKDSSFKEPSIESARLLLAHQSGPYTQLPSIESRGLSMEADDAWIKRRAAALAVQNIIRIYIRGLSLYRRGRKARIIQQEWRRYHCQRRYFLIQRGITTVQRLWRHNEKCKVANVEAIKIQSLWRRFYEKRSIERSYAASLKIQKLWRKVRLQRAFFAQKSVAIVCQSYARGHFHRVSYLRFYSAILSLQRLYRCTLCKAQFGKEWQKCLIIQRNVRGLHKRRAFLVVLWNVNFLQKTLRRFLSQRRFEAYRAAVVLLQASFRRHALKKKLLVRNNSAKRIQKIFRGFIFRTQRAQKIVKAKVIQRFWRSVQLLQRRQQSRSIAALGIQALFRQKAAKNLFILSQSSIIKIQGQWRCYAQAQSYKKQIASLVCIQKSFRRSIQTKRYLLSRAAIVNLQARSRGQLTRIWLRKTSLAVTKVQCAWRGSLYRSTAIRISRAARKIQGALIFYQYRMKKSRYQALLLLQRVTRGHRDRRRVCDIKQAVIKIQSYLRYFIARSFFMATRSRIITLQARVRGFSRKAAYTRAQNAAIKIQGLLYLKKAKHLLQKLRREKRGTEVRDQAAAKIQCLFRRALALSSLEKRLYACIRIQAFFRHGLARNNFLKLQGQRDRSSRTIQTWAKKYTEIQRNKNRAASRIVVLWRAFATRNRFLACLSAVVMIQKSCRGMLARKNAKKMRFVKATIVLQKYSRGFLDKEAVLRLKQSLARHKAAVKIQSHFRQALSRWSFRKFTRSIVILQSAFRGTKCRSSFMEARNSVVYIQSLVRLYQTRKKIHQYRCHVQLIQASWKRYIYRKTIHRKLALIVQYQKGRRSREAKKIQIRFRRYKMKKLYQHARQTKYARRIQRCYRQYAQLRYNDAAITVQRFLRGGIARFQHNVMLRAIIQIQAVSRRNKIINSLKFRTECAIIIQVFWRSQVVILRHSTRNRNALTINALVRGFLVRRRMYHQHKASSILQRAWRRHILDKRRSQSMRRKQLYQLSRQTKYAMLLQLRIRTWLKTKRRKNIASKVIQTCFRRHFEHKKYEDWRSRLISTQAAVRGHQQLSSFNHRRKASIIIQKFWRMYSARFCYLRLRESVICLQARRRQLSAYQMLQIRMDAIKTIQRLIRGYSAKLVSVGIRAQNSAAVSIQRCVRIFLARKAYAKARSAIIVIQSFGRMITVKSTFWYLSGPSPLRLLYHKAARKIQFAFLLWKMRQVVLEMKSSAIILDRCMKGQLVRSAARFALSHMTASMRAAPISPITRVSSPTNTLREAAFFSWSTAVDYARVTAAVVIQASARRMIVRSKLHDELGISFDNSFYDASLEVLEAKAASKIQAAFRKRIENDKSVQQRMNDAARLIQSQWRHFAAKILFQSKREIEASWALQRFSRSILATKSYFELRRARESKRRAAASKIQRHFKKHMVFVRHQRASLSIQAFVRSSLCSKKYQRIRMAAIQLQCLTRRVQAASLYQRMREDCCARKIQKTVRQKKTLEVLRCRYVKRRACISIQFCFRSYLRRVRMLCEKAALKIQTTMRRFLASKHALKVKNDREIEATKKLQAICRSFLARKVVISKRRHAPMAMNTEIDAFLSHLEATVQKSVAEKTFTGVCNQRLAHLYQDIARKATTSASKDVSSYLKSLQEFQAQLSKSQMMMDAISKPPNRGREQNVFNRKDTTPRRSNKGVLKRAIIAPSIPTTTKDTHSNDQMKNRQSFGLRNLIMEGRALPKVTTHVVTHSATNMINTKSKETTPSPPTAPADESFFEGNSNNIPSPIKTEDDKEDTDDWDWLDAW